MRIYFIERSLEGENAPKEYAMLNSEDHSSDRLIQGLEDSGFFDKDFFNEHKLGTLEPLLQQALFGRRIPLPHLRAIYSLVSFREETEDNGQKKLTFLLKPIVLFDDDENPVPVGR